jgi:hypothetical protein
MSLVTPQRTASTTVEAQQYIADLYADNVEYYRNDPRGRGSVGELQTIFQTWHYVAELLQNALDEEAGRIRLLVEQDRLTFEHDGRPFEARNVFGLCTKGLSPKGAGTVGFMGLGFKSVFHRYERAAVSSGVWRFFLEVPVQREERYKDSHLDWTGCFLPRWFKGLEPPSPGMNCRFVFTGRRGGAIAADLAQVLGPDRALLALLAWRGVRELYWADRQWALKADPTPLRDGERRLILTARDQQGSSQRWVLFEREYQPSKEAIAAFLTHRGIRPSPEERERVYEEAARRRQVALFCSLKDGRPEPVGKRGRAYSMLPTNVTTPLGMHLQADWLLNTSREELIHRDNNAWHEAIRDQIPALLGRVMEWTAVLGRQGVPGWERGYDALPEAPAGSNREDAWLIGPEFEAGLGDELRSLPVLPLPPKKGQPVEFTSPDQARLLPRPLAALFEEAADAQRLLFGTRAVSVSILGRRALGCLDRLGLLEELNPCEVEEHWQDGKAVAAWLRGVPKKERDATLVRLLEALAELDEGWQEADLACLPTEGKGWTGRTGLLRFPRNWDTVSADERVRDALLPCAGTPDHLLASRFDAFLRQTQTRVDYLTDCQPQDLKSITDRWWDQLPEQPSEEQAELVVYFTNWVRKKMPRASRLVNKVLARFPRKRKQLLDGCDVLLADPYASAHRRVLFEDVPAVVREYLEVDEADAAAWRTFFDSLAVTHLLQGDLLHLNRNNLTSDKLRDRVGQEQTFPYLERSKRLWWMSWHPQHYRLDDYAINADLWEWLSASDVRRDLLMAFAAALHDETPQYLEARSCPRIRYYVPWKQRDHESKTLHCPAAWLNQLAELRWIFAGENGPFRPGDVLPPGSPAEDGAPVATLPPGLVEKLPGLEFRKPLADASAVERLRILGPLEEAPPRLATLLDVAREECAEPDGDCQALIDVLDQTPLFPARDRTRRPYARLIGPKPRQTAVPRLTDLGGFLLWVDDLPEPVAAAVERLEKFDESLRVPEVVIGAQVLAFIQDVWERLRRAPDRPAEDSLAQNMALAYRYLVEDLDAEETAGGEALREEWEEVLPGALVFADRRWGPVEAAVFDDLNEIDLRKLMPGVSWATGGPLGSTLDERKRAARLLGLRLLSEQVRREALPGKAREGVDVEGWRQRFARLAIVLAGLQDRERPHQASLDDPAASLELQVVRSLSLRTTWVGGVKDRPIPAWLTEGTTPQRLYVTGEPGEFSLAAFDLLLRRFPGLRGGPALAGRLSLLLAYLGDEEAFDPLLAAVCAEYEIEPPPCQAASGGQEETDGEGDKEPDEGRKEEPGGASSTKKRKGGGSSGGGSGPAGSSYGGGRGQGARDGGAGSGGGPRGGQDGGWVPGTGANPECPPPSLQEQHDDKRGRDAVRKYETDHGRVPGRELPPLNEGFDMTSLDPVAQVTRRIEVKGIDDWNVWAVSLTAAQFRHGIREPDQPGVEYWLYVVDHVNSEKPRVFAFRKAAQRVQRFYFRADAWREHADERGEVELPVDPLIDAGPLFETDD